MDDEEEEKLNDNSQVSGPFVVKGMRLRIEEFTLSMEDNGRLTGSLSFQTSLDMCPYWLRIAYNHLLETEQASKNLLDAKQGDCAEDIGRALEQEFLSGTQAITAAGIAIDAFYARVKEHVEIPNEVSQAWRNNKTARYKQIAETLRIAFGLQSAFTASLRKVLKQNFGVRDMAVHPSSEPKPLALHPELNQVTDWRFATFCFRNAKVTVKLAFQVIHLIASLSEENHFSSSELKDYCQVLTVKIKPLVDEWNIRYGNLVE